MVAALAPSRRKSLEAPLEALHPAFQGEVSIEGRGKLLLLELEDIVNTVVECLPLPLCLERESVACLAQEALEVCPRLPPCPPLEVRAKDFSWGK